ncbi:MAG TPA: protoglobin domain-containing protein [Thermodesulfovibrionales bacterium]|nr:protoglobin domain-containing protein [Thermodesulfovibrionales bacterium]
MRSFKEIKKHYDFTEEDEKRLSSLSGLMADNVDGAMESLDSWILTTKETAVFFAEESRRKRVFAAHRYWFIDLFSGRYDTQYYERLIRIGQTHVRVSVDAHFMNRAVNILRNFCTRVISGAIDIDDGEERTKILISLQKILDINLDVITSSYIEEELRTFSRAYRVKNALVTFSEGFSQTTNFILVLALIGLTLGVVGLFFSDVYRLITGNLEHGIITALGSLLILWVMVELMNTEIAHLKGGKFYISVFIGVALVAFIREALILTLKNETHEIHYYYIALILVLGVVFWLVTKAEERSR